MTTTRLFSTTVALVALCACMPDRALEVRTISLDHLTGAQALALAEPYLSKEGQVFSSPQVLNAITVRDHSRNVERIRSMLSSRDASPSSVALHFQLVRATEAGDVGAGLENLADALGELLRFKGYELMSEAVVSASERGTVEQSLDGGGIPLQLGLRINDIRGSERNGSVELEVELRRPGGQLLATNVVVPVGQTVVLGSAYPGNNGSALILTVRGEIGSRELRSSSRKRHNGGHEANMREHVEAVAGEVAVRTEAATTTVIVGPATGAAVGQGVEIRKAEARTRPPARAAAPSLAPPPR